MRPVYKLSRTLATPSISLTISPRYVASVPSVPFSSIVTPLFEVISDLAHASVPFVPGLKISVVSFVA